MILNQSHFEDSCFNSYEIDPYLGSADSTFEDKPFDEYSIGSSVGTDSVYSLDAMVRENESARQIAEEIRECNDRKRASEYEKAIIEVKQVGEDVKSIITSANVRLTKEGRVIWLQGFGKPTSVIDEGTVDEPIDLSWIDTI